MTGLPGMESFLVRPARGAPSDALETIADQVATMGGLVLMATGGGSLVVALPRGGKEMLSANPLVGLVGGVTLTDDGKASKALRQRFAVNAAQQLVREGRLDLTDPAPDGAGATPSPSRSPVAPLWNPSKEA